MSKILIGVIVCCFLAILVAAQTSNYYGYSSTAQRLDDPYSRGQYFGLNYDKEYVNFGSKGPTSRITDTGSKSAYSSVFNIDTNSFSNQGRNPGRISNYDPGVRGFSRLDVSVDLTPAQVVSVNEELLLAKGTARIISVGSAYGAGLNNAYPKSQIWIQTRNLPPVGDETVYEAWLVDEESGYPLSLGVLNPSALLTTQHFIELGKDVSKFEGIMITLEDYPDDNPSPSTIVLYGDFGQSRNVVKAPTSWFERIR